MFSGLRGHVRAVVRMKLAKQDHRSNIYCKPPKEKIGPGVNICIIIAMFPHFCMVKVKNLLFHLLLSYSSLQEQDKLTVEI